MCRWIEDVVRNAEFRKLCASIQKHVLSLRTLFEEFCGPRTGKRHMEYMYCILCNVIGRNGGVRVQRSIG